MNRQFQNYSKSGQQVSYMERPNNQSQVQYTKNQNNNIDMTTRNQAGPQKQIYNPNPFNSYDNLSMSSQMNSNLDTQSAISKPSGPGGSSKEKKEIGVLFYSNNCEHSKKFLINLMKTNFNDLVRKICVDRKDAKIPSIVKSVPTLIARGINRPLVGEQVFAWLENETAKGAVNEEIKCFSFNCKDNFTFIDGGEDDDTVVGGSVAEWDKDYSINAPMDVDTKNDSKKGVDKQKMVGYTSDVSKMQEERNAMFAQNKPKAAQLDPDEFNKMFLKQQQKSQTNNFKQNVRNI
jgi:hypothetical protein